MRKMGKKVFVFDSSYSLLVYCVLYPQDIDSTIYIHSDNAGLQQLNFNNKKNYVFKKGKTRLGKLFCYFLFYFRLIMDSTLREIIFHKNEYSFIGQDHLFFSRPFVNEFVLIEDGLANYKFPKYNLLYRFFLGEQTFGRSNNVKKIMLSGMNDEIDDCIKHKVEVFNLSAQWNELSVLQKNHINRIFNFSKDEVLNADVMILTQPLSEYGFISETEKINIYKDLIGEYSKENIIIRRHPRESTNYSAFFPGVLVSESKTPVELVMLNSPGVKKAVTLFSSGVFNMPCQEKIFKGTSYHPLLSQKFGVIKSAYSNNKGRSRT